MRYLKLYENFYQDNNDKDKLSDNIESSLVNLVDIGFVVDVSVGNDAILIEIKKKGDPEIRRQTLTINQGWDFFTFDDIEDDIRLLSDYLNDKYKDIKIEYSPETRWDNKSYFNLDDIDNGTDLVSFDIYIKEIPKNNIFIKENFTRPIDAGNNNKDWGKDGFKGNESDLEQSIKNIFVELEDDNHVIDVRLGKMAITISLEHRQKDEVNNEGLDLTPINYELTKECSESVLEYIIERNPDLSNRNGIQVMYQVEHYNIVENEDTGTIYKDWQRDSIYKKFPGDEWKDKIIQLKIYISV